MGTLFGTDGVRGIANIDLTCELAINLGRAAAVVLTEETKHKPKVLIGKDTRISSDMLEGALTAGLCSIGADVITIGYISTPAVAYLVRKYKADAGIMISASHNPCEYNGIKIFDGKGLKLSDENENKIEALMEKGIKELPTGGALGNCRYEPAAVDDYVRYIISSTPTSLAGLKVAIDCANGSASITAKKIFTGLGCECMLLSDKPDGVNINDNCGSTHMEKLCQFVKRNKCHAGIAFDGDADRCLCTDENGNIIDGDQLIAIFSDYLMEKGKLKNDAAVVTVMSNLGFFKFCEKRGIKCIATKVGDRYVLEEMLKNDYKVGGEQSGHIIFTDYSTTGDGQLSAAMFLSVMLQKGERASKIAGIMERYPQVMINVTVSAEGKAKFSFDEKIKAAIEQAEAELNGDGRILVRISGTEPLIRVMVEGKDFDVINNIAVKVSDVIKDRLC